MARVTPTREYVRAIAQELLLSGVSPTQSKIRDLIFSRYGTKASPNVVGNELEQFWKSNSAAHGNKTPGEDALAPSKEMPVSVTPGHPAHPAPLHAAALHSRESSRVSQLEADLATADLAIAKQEHESNELRSALALALEETSALRRQSRESTSTLQNQAQELGNLKETLKKLEGVYELRIEELKTVHAEQINQMTAEKKREFEMWDGMRKHLMLETDRIRVEHAAKLVGLTEQLERAHLFEQQWRAQAARQAEDIAKANNRATRAEEMLALANGTGRRA